MRIVVFGIIAVIAVVIIVMARGGGCSGAVVRSEHDCLRVEGFDRAFCARAFARPEEAIYRAGNVFRTHAECSARFTVCIPYPGVNGWTPEPKGFCLIRQGDEAIMTPNYDSRGS